MRSTRKSCKEWIYCLFIFITLTGISNSIYAQTTTRIVTGVVTDEDGTTLPGAAVLVKGTKTSASTTVDGKYSIAVPSDASVLVFS
jgi:hypothetical protein